MIRCGGVLACVTAIPDPKKEKAPDDLGGAWKQVGRTLSGHAPLQNGGSLEGHDRAPLKISLARSLYGDNSENCKVRRPARAKVGPYRAVSDAQIVFLCAIFSIKE